MVENNESNNDSSTDTIHEPIDSENIHTHSTSTSSKDTNKTSADIVQDKKQFNLGNMEAKNNHADNLVIIQHAIIDGGISMGEHTIRNVVPNHGKVDNTYDLSDVTQCDAFGNTFKAGEHLAFAIILCVFEYVELNDLKDLKSKLLSELPPVIDAERNEVPIYQDAYLPLNHLLTTVNGEIVVLEEDEEDKDYIRLCTNRPKALKNLWQQFGNLHEPITRWLLNVYDSFEYRTNFDTIQMTAAFVNILKVNFASLDKYFLPRLKSNPDKYWLMGFIALELYNDLSYRSKILPYLIKWAESSSAWLWKPAVYVYANMKSGEESIIFEKKVRKALENRYSLLEYDNLRKENLPFIGMLLIASERFRTLISSLLYNMVSDTHNYTKKRSYCFLYLELLKYAYYVISSKIMALPLVACDQKQQLVNLFPLLELTLSRYDTRNMLFMTLEAYIKEISRYHVNKKTINHIKAFFQFIVISDSRFLGDITLFLKKCDCSLAKEINEFLQNEFPLPANLELSLSNVADGR